MSIAEFGELFTNHFQSDSSQQVRPINVGRLDIDSDFVIRRTYDKWLGTLLGENQLTGKNFIYLIKQRVSDSDYRKIIPILQILVIKQDLILSPGKKNPFDCLKISLPGQNGRKVTKYIRFEFRKGEAFRKNGLLTVVLRDISKSVRISRQIRLSTEKAELKVNTMMSLLQFERDLIREFLESTIFSLKGILKNLTTQSRSSEEVRQRIENIYCIVHQIKGDAAILNMHAISQQAHDFESLLSTLNMKRRLCHGDLRHLNRPLKSIIDSVKEIKEIFEKIVEGGWSNSKSGGGDSMMRRLQYLIKRLAEDNRKRVIIVDDGYLDSAVPLYLRRVVSSLVTQLARNAVVHGIEDAKTRAKLNKTPYGCLHVSVNHVKGNLIVTTRDDGRGIDPEKIKRTALRSKLFHRQHVMRWNKTQLLNAIFKPGFTTAKSVTQHAGRGVGLDVIKSTVEKYGGTINIRSSLGEFTEFSMSFPRLPKGKKSV